MAWERRGNNRYYYGKRREGKRCVSEYHGSDATGTLIAACDTARRDRAEQERAAAQAERRRIEGGSQTVKTLAAQLRALTAAALVSNGYHQHKGQWRRRMEHSLKPGESMTMVPAAPSVDPAEVQRGLQALQAALTIVAQPTGEGGKVTIVQEAQADLERRKAVRQVLQAYLCIWPKLRERVAASEDALITVRCDPSSASGQLAHFTLKAMRDELGYHQAPLLEQLLMEHVALAWFDFDTVQLLYGQMTSGSHTYASGAYWDRRLNSAQQRYLRAVETLARVRRLAMVTPLQVNIGGRQVNVAGGS